MKKPNICVVTFSIYPGGNTPLCNLLDILEPLSDNFHLITGCEYEDVKKRRIHVDRVKHVCGKNPLSRVINYFLTQVKISYKLLKHSNTDIFLFFLGGDCLILPMVVAKVMNKKVIMISTGSPTLMHVHIRDMFTQAVKLLSEINYSLADQIVLYSNRLVYEWNLGRYKDKIKIAHEHFINQDSFKITTQLKYRSILIGYAGRLSGEKGIMNLIESIPLVLKKKNDLQFIICGEGPLYDNINEYIDSKNLKKNVDLVGWIAHDKLPEYLNNLQLLVIPSDTEGLPNVMLEAMACGTPVLATPVGAIPDVITDGETGFIMSDNSPEVIAKNILRSLSSSNLDNIPQKANELITKKYTYDVAVENYRKILQNLLD
jgi:glycosyltransferase involved in cell wall biosynthesis